MDSIKTAAVGFSDEGKEWEVAVQYRPIPGFTGYRIGDDGSVWSRWSKRGVYHKGTVSYLAEEWKQLRLMVNSNGYCFVNLKHDSGVVKRCLLVHRMVLEVFVGPCPAGMEGCHDNGVRTDCRLLNLRWDTRKNNHADKKKHGTNQAGEKHAMHKLKLEQVVQIRENKKGLTTKQLAEMFGMSASTIKQIKSGKLWKCQYAQEVQAAEKD